MTTWPRTAWQARLAPWLPDVQVQVLDEVDSSNTELMRRVRAGSMPPTVLVALTQTAGRGRLGRNWNTAPGQALTFSLGLPLDLADWSGLSLAVGVALAQALHPDIRLKWPNDLWWQQRKLAGILIETAQMDGQRFAVIGIGINLAQPQASGLSTAPAWLQELLPGIDAVQAMDRVLLPLVQALRRFEAQGFAAFAAEFAQRDGLLGLGLRLSDGQEGLGRGVAANGALRLQTAAGLKHITSSEVSVRVS